MMRDRFWIFRLLIVAALFSPYCANAQPTQDGCTYLPEFQALSAQLSQQPAGKAAVALARYITDHDNLENCEYTEIDRMLSEKEAQLFRVITDKTDLKAQIVYRCNQFDSRTANCESPMLDNTAHPFSAGISPLAIPGTRKIKFVSELPGATLQAIYRISLADAIDGKSAILLSSKKSELLLISGKKDFALMAIYKTTGPWRYRKVVWYF
jgi:hypothetical protein